ncbi:TetR/AcrR family transcriptional regulator [Parasedimentitalea psychrophila]|uniref:TetR/AcrR family transcriptional regulator n=1 Tax=Parasedimentitalea psychrophila TaxID=2997337 RepID=A0A9Y2P8Y3_9RHOB|nr:TetR/AcrR family transcriptional regulator [Parasedimentitalea psychrophila]WIY27528.1 TetR/AcrR family transcriptional regulator [Parasedimentitalea psychrophila]
MKPVRKIRKRDPVRTGKAILSAGRAEFSVAGYEGARVDRVAEKSNMSKGLIYHYFGSKSGLFLAILEDIYQELRDENSGLVLDDFEPEEGIRQLINHTFTYFSKHPEFLVLVNSENMMHAEHLKKSVMMRDLFRPIVVKIQALLDRGARQGIFREDVDVIQLYVSIVGLGYFFLGNRHTLEVVFDTPLFEDDTLSNRQRHIEDMILSYLRPNPHTLN